MNDQSRAAPPRRHAAVFSGGGAKGVFESGVVHALVRAGYEPEVITGSSVGAINAATLAELIRTRREEGDVARDALLEKSLRLWQSIDRWKIADFDPWGRRIFLVAAACALVAAGLGYWAFAGPAIPAGADFWLRAAALVAGVAFLWAAGRLVWWWRSLPRRLHRRIQHGMTAAPELAPAEPAIVRGAARRFLKALGLYPSLFNGRGLESAVKSLIPTPRRFADYQRIDVELRLTRTNLRTGRTEVSESVHRGHLMRPGSVRGRRVLGDPEVVPSVLASAAFPVAYPTVDAERLYPPADNPDLYGVVAGRAHALRGLSKLFGERTDAELIWLHSLLDTLEAEDPTLLQVGREGELYKRLKDRFVGDHAPWIRVSDRTVDLFVETRHWPELPLPEFASHGDRYFDGGVLDNTPLSSALAALRDRQATDDAERAEEDGQRATAIHEMLVVLLSPPARHMQLSAVESESMAGPELGLRALRLQAEQRLAADAHVAEKISRLLARQDESHRRATAATRTALAGAGRGAAGAAPGAGRVVPGLELPEGENWRDILRRESRLPETTVMTLDVRVPERLAQVELTRVVPGWDLPWVLSLDDRLGFRASDAEAFQVRGCRDTLQALAREHRRRGVALTPPPHVRRAAELLGSGALTRPVLPGWICRVEHCLLRGTCDRVAAREAKSARDFGEATAASV